jgi:hypothetical protein
MPVEFKQKKVVSTVGLPVVALLGKKSEKGQVGLEIEVEGKNIPIEGLPKQWKYVKDHSLRGQENAEYVLEKPLMFSDVPEALDDLWGLFKDHKTSFDDSNRTSVHVHVNCQDFCLNRLAAFLALWYSLEEPLTEFCGEFRVGNLFCLRGIDAPATVSYLKRFIASDGQVGLSEMLHYSGINPHALNKYGSLEIRTLRGCSDPDVIKFWIACIQRLYELSADYPDPRDVPARYSQGGPLSFFYNALGHDLGQELMKSIGWSSDDLSAAILRGVRLAQGICYCRDWDLFKPLEVKADPFGREAKKIVKKIAKEMDNNPPTPQISQPVYDEWGELMEPDDEEHYQPAPDAPSQPQVQTQDLNTVLNNLSASYWTTTN